MSQEIIAAIRDLVERACAADANVFGYGIWSHHITRVADHGVRLAPDFGADPEIVEIAALLHDYASVKDEALYPDHHVHGPIEAGKLLAEQGYPPARIKAVQHAIAAHRASAPRTSAFGGASRPSPTVPGARCEAQQAPGAPVERRSAEAECLANADALAHLENVPSLLHLAYVRRRLGIDDGAAWVRAKLNRSWGKLSPRLRDEATSTYRAALRVLEAAPARRGAES